MNDVPTTFGALLRSWRQRRRQSQLDLSLAADVSTRHISFLENGRSSPSREMVLVLAEQLDVPLRERNQLLHAAGFAPAYEQTPLQDDRMQPVTEAIRRILAVHDPYPAIAVDRYWNIVDMNVAAAVFANDVDPELLGPPINVYRLGLHPNGLAPHVINFADYADDVLRQLRRDVERSADPNLAALLAEVTNYPNVRALGPPGPPGPASVVIPVRLRHPLGELSLFTAIATFGTPVDVTVAEMAIETFFPANAETASRLQRLVEDLRATG